MNCIHHWVLAEHVPHATYDEGTCKLCGETKRFVFQVFDLGSWVEYPPIGRGVAFLRKAVQR
jgi:hypothetical protein